MVAAGSFTFRFKVKASLADLIQAGARNVSQKNRLGVVAKGALAHPALASSTVIAAIASAISSVRLA